MAAVLSPGHCEVFLPQSKEGKSIGLPLLSSTQRELHSHKQIAFRMKSKISQNTFILTKIKTDGLQPDVLPDAKRPTYSHFVFFGV